MKKKILSLIAIMTILSSVFFVLTGCGNNKGESKQEESTKSEQKKEFSISDKDNYFVIINGTKLNSGDGMSSVTRANLKLKEKDLEETVPKNRYLLSKSVLDSNDKAVCSFVALNLSEEKVKYADAVIGGFEVGEINYNKLSQETLALNIEVVGGIKLGSTLEDITKVFGEDYYKYEAQANETLKMPSYTTYKYSRGYKGYEFTIDDSGKVSRIKWNNYDK